MISTDFVIDSKIFVLIDKMIDFLSGVKNDFDNFDKNCDSQKDQIEYLEFRKKEIFQEFDVFFDQLWAMVKDLDQKEFKLVKKYYEKKMFLYLGDGIEINTHIRSKPFGYGGDFITMNYIYDYHEGRYLGETTYQRLINNYTCNIDVARSNIIRKNYIKKLIFDFSNTRDGVKKILSIGSGPAREIEELIREQKLNTPFIFSLVDFESEALLYVKERLRNLKFDKDMIKIEFIKTDLIKLIKDDTFKNKILSMDLVYISGVFDYLSDRLCKKLTCELASFLSTNSTILIANMSLEKAKHRAYYEMFGDWVMVHRKKEEMINWVSSLNRCDFSYEIREVSECKSYHFLTIKRS